MVCIAALAIITGCATARPATPAVTTVYLVRHGEKSLENPADPDPALTSAGRARAAALAVLLANTGVTNVISTQWRRTLDTARPLATVLGLTTEIVPSGGPAFADSTAAAILRHRGGTILVVGHSNSLAAVIGVLGGPRFPDLCDSEYSTMFVMRIFASPPPSLVRQHYGTADPAPDSACTAMRGR
jgi:phosphohistidine phosphatase SixA